MTRLSPEREAEIRRYATGAREFAKRHPDKPMGESGKVMLDLLAEIDALREERDRAGIVRAAICGQAAAMFIWLPEAQQEEFIISCRNTPGPCFCGCHISETMKSG